MVDAFVCSDGVKMKLRYNKAKITDERAVEIAEKAVKTICSFVK
jgi:hypothetical protein